MLPYAREAADLAFRELLDNAVDLCMVAPGVTAQTCRVLRWHGLRPVEPKCAQIFMDGVTDQGGSTGDPPANKSLILLAT
jgi:hypothetical protein